MEKIIWGVDPGSTICGVSQLRGGSIGYCFNETPEKVYNRIMKLCEASKVIIVIEDIFPYSMKLTPAVIETCKLIGELTYRFKKNKQVLSVNLIPRNTVKKWIFETCPEVCDTRIEKKIISRHATNIKAGKRGFVKQDGSMRKPSFNWVDDKIVKSALIKINKIESAQKGKQNIYGLKDHSWQALALVQCFAHTDQKVSETS